MRPAIPTLHARNLCDAIQRASVAIHVRASRGRNAAEVAGATAVPIVGLVEGMITGTTGVGRIAVPTAVPIVGETAGVDALNAARGVDTVAVITADIMAEGTHHNAVHN